MGKVPSVNEGVWEVMRETGSALLTAAIRKLVPCCALCVCLWPVTATAATGAEATHETDHAEDMEVLELQEVHVHGLPLNKDQQLGPVPRLTPWPKIPPHLDGKEIDDWMKARFLGPWVGTPRTAEQPLTTTSAATLTSKDAIEGQLEFMDSAQDI